ncbi:MAG: C-GCAxxG-C-C family protein [Promethearchaeota archaeon]|jgi:C_GCAxxG_C_C family probable redox protein
MMQRSKEKILAKAFDLGKKYEKKYTGCAQTTIAAVFQALGIWNDDVFRAGSGLADGLGLTGDGTCGALTGGSMAISYLFGREYKDFGDMYKPMESYRLVKKLHDDYVEKYGSCRCHDVQKAGLGRSYNLWDPKEMKEAFESNMMEHCSELVGNVARLAAEIILEAGYTPE